MPKISYIFKDGQWVPKSHYDRVSELHYVKGDEIEPLKHPCDGKIYTSKSAFERVTREHNCICVGDEPIENLMWHPEIDYGDVERDVVEAMEMLQTKGDARDKLMKELEGHFLGDEVGINPFGNE